MIVTTFECTCTCADLCVSIPCSNQIAKLAKLILAKAKIGIISIKLIFFNAIVNSQKEPYVLHFKNRHKSKIITCQ